MACIGKLILIFVLSFFYGYVLFLTFHPNVSDTYYRFYIERTITSYPGVPVFEE